MEPKIFAVKAYPIHRILRFHQILKFSIINEIRFVMVWDRTGVQGPRVLRWSINNGRPQHTYATSAPLIVSLKNRIKFRSETNSSFNRFALLLIHHNWFLLVLDATSTYIDHAGNANHGKFLLMAAESILSNLFHILAYLHSHSRMRSKSKYVLLCGVT